MRVRLKTQFGQFWDRKLRWGITAGEEKELPCPVPMDTLTFEKLKMGGFEIVTKDEGIPDIGGDIATDDETVESSSAPEDPSGGNALAEGALAQASAPERPLDRAVSNDTEPVPKTAAKKRGRPKKTK